MDGQISHASYKKSTFESHCPKAEANPLTSDVLLQAISHPFILESLRSFQNNSYLFLELEFVPGGDLYDYLLDHGAMTEPHAQFYIAGIVLAIEYLQVGLLLKCC